MSLSKRIREKQQKEAKSKTVKEDSKGAEIIPEDLNLGNMTDLASIASDMFANMMESKYKEPREESHTIKLDYEPPSDDPVKHYMFISDVGVNVLVKHQLNEFKSVKSYNQNFVNRNCKDLVKLGVDHIWLNLSSKPARDWLQKNLKPNQDFVAVLVYGSSKRSKFLDDLDGLVQVKCKLKDLKKLRGMSISQLVGGMDNFTTIHDKPHCLAWLVGCSKSIKPKKKASY